MFNWSKKKSKLLYKYLFSYLLVFMLPFITISTILYHISVGKLEKEIIRSNMDKIDQIKDMTDTRLSELNSLATKISYDHRLTPYMLTEPYYDQQAIEELIRYKMSNSFIDEIFLNFNESKDLVYSSKGTSTFHTFVQSTYPVKNKDIEALNKGMQIQSNPLSQIIDIASKNSNGKRVIAYSYPIPIQSSSPYGTVTFFIKEETLSKLMKNALGDFEGNSFIFDADYNLFASNENGVQIDLDFVKNISANNDGNTHKDFKNEDYSFSIARSQLSGWTFVSVMPTQQFYGKMTSLKYFIFMVLLGLAVVGITVVCYLSFKQYKPIQNLAQYLGNKEQMNHSKKQSNEIELIRTKIESIYEDSEFLKRKIIAHKPFVRAQFLTNLLKGEGKEHQDIIALANDLKISLRGDSFFVIAVSYKGKIKKQETFTYWKKIVETIHEISHEECCGYGVELVHDYTAAIIVNIKDDSSNWNESRQLFSHHLIELLKKHCSILPFVGIGQIYKEANKINRSFIEATASIENDILHHETHAIFFEDLSIDNDETIWFPEESRLKFIQSLKQGDRVVAKETLAEILDSLAQKKFPSYMLKCTCFDLINTVLKTIAELGIEHNPEEVKRLSDFQTLDQLKESATIFIDQICLEVEKRKESHNDQLRDNIMEYIQKQYKQHTLSLEMISDHFQISSSYVSRFIREQTGITFTQLVWKLRMDEFKQQLVNTNRTIKEIVLDIGYFDVSNFTRKFRKEEGITPSQYRKYHQQNRDDKKAL